MPVQTTVVAVPQTAVAGQIDTSYEPLSVPSRVAAAALTAGLLACFTSGASTVRHLAPDAADVDAIIATGGSTGGVQSLSGGSLDGATGGAVMRQARNLTFTFSNHADWDATTITVVGKGVDGEYLTETFAVPNGGNATVTGNALFTQVDSVSIPAQSGTGGTFTMGTGSKLGPIDACAAGVVPFETSRSSASFASGEVAPVVRTGRVWVTAEEAVAEGHPVFVRMVAGGGESVGAFRDTPDSTDCALLRNARWASTTTGSGLALLELNLP